METTTRFVSVKQAAQLSGLSMYYIRNELRNGTVPYLLCGRSVKIDYPAFVERMATEAARHD